MSKENRICDEIAEMIGGKPESEVKILEERFGNKKTFGEIVTLENIKLHIVQHRVKKVLGEAEKIIGDEAGTIATAFLKGEIVCDKPYIQELVRQSLRKKEVNDQKAQKVEAAFRIAKKVESGDLSEIVNKLAKKLKSTEDEIMLILFTMGANNKEGKIVMPKNTTPETVVYIADEILSIMDDAKTSELGIDAHEIARSLMKRLEISEESAAKKVSSAFCGKLKNEVYVVGTSKYARGAEIEKAFGDEIAVIADTVEMYMEIKEVSCVDTRAILENLDDVKTKLENNHYLLKTILTLDGRFKGSGKVMVELLDPDGGACEVSSLGDVFKKAYEQADTDGLTIDALVKVAKKAGSAAKATTIVPLMSYYGWERLPKGKGYCPPGSKLAENIKDIKEHGDYGDIEKYTEDLLKKMPKGFYVDELRKIGTLKEITISDVMRELKSLGYAIYGKRTFGIVFPKNKSTGAGALVELQKKGMSSDEIVKKLKIPEDKKDLFKKRLSLLKYLGKKEI